MEFTKLKIDKGITVPVGRNHFDFSSFEVGDSTFMATSANAASFSPAYQSAMRYGKLNGKKFTGQTVIENGVKGVRMWRIK